MAMANQNVSSYSTMDHLPDLTASEMASANTLVFEPYESADDLSNWIDWDSKAGVYGSNDYAILHSVYKFQGTEGATYDIVSTSFFDPYLLRVYDSQGNVIAANSERDDPSYGKDWIWDWVAPYTGDFYVDANWNQGDYYQFYSLNVYADLDTARIVHDSANVFDDGLDGPDASDDLKPDPAPEPEPEPTTDEVAPVTSVINGTVGSDILYSSNGNDQIEGGGGIDTVVYSGIRSDYLVSLEDGSVEDLMPGRDGVDTVTNVERLQFSDSSLALDIEGIAGQAYRIYKAAFDRVPDTEGLGFWIHQMDQGTDLTVVAQGFIGSQEFESMYGQTTDNEFIELLYENVLDRQPDADGYAFWKEAMHEAGLTREEVLVQFSESVENVNNTDHLISDGISYNPFFS